MIKVKPLIIYDTRDNNPERTEEIKDIIEDMHNKPIYEAVSDGELIEMRYATMDGDMVEEFYRVEEWFGDIHLHRLSLEDMRNYGKV